MFFRLDVHTTKRKSDLIGHTVLASKTLFLWYFTPGRATIKCSNFVTLNQFKMSTYIIQFVLMQKKNTLLRYILNYIQKLRNNKFSSVYFYRIVIRLSESVFVLLNFYAFSYEKKTLQRRHRIKQTSDKHCPPQNTISLLNEMVFCGAVQQSYLETKKNTVTICSTFRVIIVPCTQQNNE